MLNKQGGLSGSILNGDDYTGARSRDGTLECSKLEKPVNLPALPSDAVSAFVPLK